MNTVDYAVVHCPDGTSILIWLWGGEIRTFHESTRDYENEPRTVVLRDISKGTGIMGEDPAKRKARHARYNASAKGKARNERYEKKHKRGFRLGKISGYKKPRYE